MGDQNQWLLLTSIELSREYISTKSLIPCSDHEGFHVSNTQSDSKLLDLTRSRSIAFYHQMAICPMGQKRGSSALANDQLQAYGIQNLRIIEAFLIPTMPMENLNAGVLMIVKTIAGRMTENATLEVLSQNYLSTAYLSCMKLGLGGLRRSRVLRLYLIQQTLDRFLTQAGQLWLVCRELLRPLEKVPGPSTSKKLKNQASNYCQMDFLAQLRVLDNRCSSTSYFLMKC